jgi:phosphoenolpyruvate-protein kinase (PTS system EI component)
MGRLITAPALAEARPLRGVRLLGERRKGCADRRGRTRRSAGRHTGELWIMTPMVTDLNEAETSSLLPK